MSHWHLVLAIIVWIGASARLTRLVVFDAYPPAAWLRAKWDDHVSESNDWNKLLHCGYCAAPWITLITMVLGLWLLPITVHFDQGQTWFWLIGSWLAASYAAAIAVAYDGDDS